jgi:multicomponent Na+:H+ antiporter subunit A
MSRTVVVDLSVRLTFHVVVVAAIYLTFAGHNQPGGGFVGGLLMGSAIAMRYAAGGIDEVRAISRVRPWTILGAGLLLAGIVAALPLLLGDEVLEAAKVELDLALLGTVKLASTQAFDLGVFLLVVGLVLMVFEAFGDDPSLDAGEGSRA